MMYNLDVRMLDIFVSAAIANKEVNKAAIATRNVWESVRVVLRRVVSVSCCGESSGRPPRIAEFLRNPDKLSFYIFGMSAFELLGNNWIGFVGDQNQTQWACDICHYLIIRPCLIELIDECTFVSNSLFTRFAGSLDVFVVVQPLQHVGIRVSGTW